MGMLLLMVFFLVLFLPPMETEPAKKQAPCDLHDWTYHPVTKKLTCTVCGLVAGE